MAKLKGTCAVLVEVLALILKNGVEETMGVHGSDPSTML